MHKYYRTVQINVVYTAEPCAMPEQSREMIFPLWFIFSFFFHLHNVLGGYLHLCTFTTELHSLCRNEYLKLDNG